MALKATKRTEHGSRRARALRRQGRVPGVIYGHGTPATPITLDRHDVELAVLHGERLMEVEVDGAAENVLIKDVQYDPLGQDLLHVDLARVRLDERVTVTVPIELRGTPKGVTEQDGVLQQQAAEVEIECLAGSIPEQIRVLVSDLQLDQTLYLGDIPLPEGATLQSDPELPVCTVTAVAEEEVAPAEEEAEAAEPEVIGQKEREQEEGQAGES